MAENILATLLGYTNSKVKGLMKKGKITASKNIGVCKEVNYSYVIESLEEGGPLYEERKK